MAWRGLILLLLFAFLGPADASAQVRKWNARSGDFTVDAELLDVASGVATLKRADGEVIKVPLAKLSLADLRYIKQALADAAGGAAAAGKKKEDAKPAEKMGEKNPFEDVEPRTTTPTPPTKEMPKETPPEDSGKEAPSEPTIVEPLRGPPLAKAGVKKWQGAPDPIPREYLIPPDRKQVSLHFSEIGTNKPFTAATSSRFMGYRESSGGSIRIFDVAQDEKIGQIDPREASIDKIMLSPDGEEIAVGGGNATTVSIYSVKDGKLKQKLDLRHPIHFSSYLAYAAPGRLLHYDDKTYRMNVVDTASGKGLVSLPLASFYGQGRTAISPGGAYLAVLHRSPAVLQIFDLRNGAVAGNLELPPNDLSYTALAFSPDGTEFAMIAGALKTRLHAWDMKTGRLTASHEFSKQLNQINGLYTIYQGPALEWLDKSRNWLFLGVAVIDRKAGGPVWMLSQPSSSNVPIRWLLDGERQLMFIPQESSDGKLQIETLPIAEFNR